jgi:peptidoglycan hydrolase CwlO-like protein
MQETRRSLLLRLFPAAAALSVVIALARGQDPFPPPRQQRPGRSGDDDSNLPEKPSTKAMLEENQKDIKKNVEKLFDLASQLKEQVEKTDSTTTLSLALVKKAEEIEKLARQIKERAKG